LSNDKKDLTRIEDLSQFIHSLEDEDEEIETSDDFTSGVPDLPESPFEDNFSSSTEESSVDLGTPEESDFSSSFSEESSNSEETVDFGTDDFTSSFHTETAQDEDDPFSDSASTSIEDNTNSWNMDVPLTDSQSTIGPEVEVVDHQPAYTPAHDFKTPETFEDLKKFSESSSFTGMATEGNPSFSVLVKNVRFIEDVNDIIILLKELNLLTDAEDQVKGRLMRGMLLIPRISEYSAIFLAHKLRRFDIDIQVGLSDEIHPPKHQETPETGIVSKFNLYQNQNHHFHFDDPKLEMSQIIVAATQSLEGYHVLRYMGVASEHKMLDSHIVENEDSEEIPRHYQELAQKLKAHALKAHSNAVVGLNYQLTPIPSEFGMGGHKYRLTCTGNLVWVNKL
jgi:uncharacterized protein YbjQ (UPF0145 family)